MDHKFNWFRYVLGFFCFFVSSFPLLFLRLHTWQVGKNVYDEHMVAIVAAAESLPFNDKSVDRPKFCPLCHQRASIIIAFMLSVFVVVTGSRSRLTQFKTLRRPTKPRGNKINPSSSHNHQMIPDHNFVVILGTRVWWIFNTQSFSSTCGCQRLFPFWYHPSQQKICSFFSLWSHDYFHQLFFLFILFTLFLYVFFSWRGSLQSLEVLRAILKRNIKVGVNCNWKGLVFLSVFLNLFCTATNLKGIWTFLATNLNQEKVEYCCVAIQLLITTA